VRSIAVVAIVFTTSLVYAGTRTLSPTTTLAAETANNTSSSASFISQSNGNVGQANISKVPTQSLLYSGSTTPIYAHFMPWFGGSNHMNVGYASNDTAQVKRQVDDMLSRGIQGAIIDWYGPNFSREDQTTQYMRNEAQTRGGTFVFAVMYDGGALNSCHATAGCDLTNQAISDLTYTYNNYEISPAYMRSNGQPVVFFFDADRFGTLNWSLIASSVPGNPIFVFRNNGGFTHASTGGSFSWVGLNTTNANDMGLSYFDSFYQTSFSYPQEQTFGSGNKGFNDSLAAWAPNPPRIQSQQCAQTWLSTLAEASKYFSTSLQLDAIQLVTWNDYEEGTEIETGIDNCVSVNASTNGNSLTWAVSGSTSTIDHFSVFISSDGSNLMWLGDAAASATSYDLGPAGMAPGNYTVFVKAVGKPSLTNKMSSGASYTVKIAAPTAALSVTPTSGMAPLTISASTAGSTSPGGTITASSINFGDGTVVSATTASHTYRTGGTFTVTGTVTNNAGLSSSASNNVTSSYGVKVTSPTNGATLASPVHVVGSATSSHPITYMRIYLDNISVYGAAVTSVNTYVRMSTGSHNVVVQAWDSTGAVFKTGVTVKVQ